jgi:hypothetical protein
MGQTQRRFFELVQRRGHRLDYGCRLSWLSNVGHLCSGWDGVVPLPTVRLLRLLHAELGGQEKLLHEKRGGSDPRPDFFYAKESLIVEVDEIQHFTSDRLLTLKRYPGKSGPRTISRTISSS